MPLKPNNTQGALTRARLEAWVAQRENVTPVALDDAAATLTAAQLVDSKLFVITPTAARDLTTATAAQILAHLADEAVGTSFEFTVVNKAPNTHAATLVGGSDVTVEGAAAVAAASSGTFVARVASGTTVVIYRK